ncbi:hypothetical protein PIB19_00300 [Sphingomonas sp. 7/4-4]|uniref:hypothetical protein n=1 Tax=Sphingomonas sp. 7/4-4 TaxID=3018446 RepID=UPI0022F3D594|nr:hypothetical protein [Sphingomonas sp. 7/4-4]WBY09986.1 hypothetical protein PIB19_00300 [Sphingomonas sp. 7/4-4]
MNQNVAHRGIIGNEKPKPPGYVEPFDYTAINFTFQRRFRPETLFLRRRDIFVARRKLLFSTHYLGPQASGFNTAFSKCGIALLDSPFRFN